MCFRSCDLVFCVLSKKCSVGRIYKGAELRGECKQVGFGTHAYVGDEITEMVEIAQKEK